MRLCLDELFAANIVCTKKHIMVGLGPKNPLNSAKKLQRKKVFIDAHFCAFYHGNYINGKSGFESKSVRILPFLSYVQYNLKILPEILPETLRVAEILHSFID